MNDPIHLLIIEDSETDTEMILRFLAREGVKVTHERVVHRDDVEVAFRRDHWNVIICDYFLPGFTWEEVLETWHSSQASVCPLLLISGITDFDSALEVMHRGASDFISKGDLSRLVPAIRREMEKAEIRRQKETAEEELKDSNQKLKLALKTLTNIQDQMIAIERFRALGEMASGIAHDFNNALTILQGSVEELADDAGGQSNEVLDRMRTQIADAASVVRRLRDYYRTNPAEEATAVDVNPILREVREFTRPKWENSALAGEKGIAVEIDEADGAIAWADASRLREILTNLIFNSCDAITGREGKIVLSSRCHEGYVEVEVTDNGSGMTKEVFNRCMEPLYSTKGQDGTGLGLAIVKSAVHSFGGEVYVESEVGTGTSVKLRLRPADLLTEELPASRRHVAIGRSLRILIVDDEPAIAALLKKQLQSLGQIAECMTDPIEAEKRLDREQFDLVMTDRSMPEMSGDKLAERIRKKYPATRVLMASGYGDLMLATGETPAGVDLIVPKPISLEMVVDALESLFSVKVDSVALGR